MFPLHSSSSESARKKLLVGLEQIMGSDKIAGKEKVSNKSLIFHRVSSDNAAIINSREKWGTGRNGYRISSLTLFQKCLNLLTAHNVRVNGPHMFIELKIRTVAIALNKWKHLT